MESLLAFVKTNGVINKVIELNKIYNENCLNTMSRMQDDFVDLVITSPPYDNLRDYNGYSFNFEPVAQELFRILKQGGVVVWIINDMTIKGSRTLTSFKQALYFKEIGFNIHDIMIWDKGCFTATGSLAVRYAPNYEFMFILSKGRPKTFNPILDRPNKSVGKKLSGTIRLPNGSMRRMSNIGKSYREFGQRFAIWDIGNVKGNKAGDHPAPFPEQLVHDHIISWSNDFDLVYDPFGGSGTTAVAAIKTNRNFILSEISDQYCKMAEERLSMLQK